MNGLQIAQKLIPKINFEKAIQDRRLNRDFQNLFSMCDYLHLPADHDFHGYKMTADANKSRSRLELFRDSVHSLFIFQLKIMRVFLWTAKNAIVPPTETHKEAIIIKGLGYQQFNPNIPFEEVFESIPSMVFHSVNREAVKPILVHNGELEIPEQASQVKSVLFALLISLKPNVLSFLKFFVQSQTLFIIAILSEKMRKLENGIPEALLFTNFQTRFKHFSILDTQGSFPNLDLFYYASNRNNNVQTYLVHYSESGMPLLSSQDFFNEVIPHYERAEVDTHIVWTKEFADFYNSRSSTANFIALGPQVFRERIVEKKRDMSDEIVLAIFDETPSFHDEFYIHIREEAGLNFLAAIESLSNEFNAKNGKKLTIHLKQKRRNLKFHSRQYLEKLEEMNSIGLIKLLPWHTNPYQMISSSDLVLSVLGSSPALIGRYLNRPTVYGYFGDGQIAPPIIDYGIPVLRNTSQLSIWINNHHQPH